MLGQPRRHLDTPATDATRWPELFASAWHDSVNRFAADPTAPFDTPAGPMAAVEYLATRVLELCVHHYDFCKAVGLPLHSTPSGLDITADLLQRLAASDLSDLAPQRLIALATGRVPTDDPRLPVWS